MMKALLHNFLFFSVLRIELGSVHIGKYSVNYTPNPCLFLTQGQLATVLIELLILLPVSTPHVLGLQD